MTRLLVHTLSVVLLVLLGWQTSAAEVFRKKFTLPSVYLIVEVLDDDLVHFEISGMGAGPALDQPLYTSPMIWKTDYPGPATLTEAGNRIDTRDMRLDIDPNNLCVAVRDKTRHEVYLTTICPADMHLPLKGFNIDPGTMQSVYGLGQEFKNLGSANGDWTSLGVRQGVDDLGNGFRGFQNAAVGNVQIPVMYALGNDNVNYALFLDNVYRQTWDFTAFWWQARMFGDQLRLYVMTGADLLDLRADYLELTGRPPVPPRKSFGLWVSEFGYDNWPQIDTLRAGLRRDHFPVDGFVLDLNWFGGVVLDNPGKSQMGRLDWDADQTQTLQDNPYSFPDPVRHIQQLADDHIALTVIEESYLARTTDTFHAMPPDFSSYQRVNGRCDKNNQNTPVDNVAGFWGEGRMIDWSDPRAGQWIHDQRRFPNLVHKGVHAHWTDLGEPETYRREACYEGVETTATGPKIEHSDIHNLYNLLWNKAIWDGYVHKQGQPDALGQVNPRPFIVTRSGAAGTQRYGAAMWSGDIASNLDSLATHANAHMHMAFSGIDYYGADIGGFRREVMPYNDKNGSYRGYEEELYTQWFANGAWFDVPVRPHTDTEFVKVTPSYATAPHLVGKTQSNLANIRQRYELIPYYYSLAYEAYLHGRPVIAPPVMYYQNDPQVRKMGHEKLIGQDILVGIVARHGEYERDMYVPAGTWVNYHTNEWLSSTGQVVQNVPVYRDGRFRLPAFARAGAIIPQMYVDEQTKDAFGNRQDGSPPHPELIVQVYASPVLSSFTLYEDDGRTLQYLPDGRPSYAFRTTRLEQLQQGDRVTITIHPTVSAASTASAPVPLDQRAHVVKLVVQNARATEVKFNGQVLPQHASDSAFRAAISGWHNAGPNLIVAKTDPVEPQTTARTVVFTLAPVSPTTSVNFVCDKGFTRPGESIYVVGSLLQLGSWNPNEAMRLDPNVYYAYIAQPPPGHHGPGPAAPVWTGTIAGLPAQTTFEWKCLRKREDGTGQVHWQPGNNQTHTTNASGYAGRSYGSF